MIIETLGAFAFTTLIIELTPGPNMAYLAVLSASQGRRAGFAATLGIALGLLTVGLAAALGLAAIIANSAFLYEALRWGGVGYLLWLAWTGWNDANETSAAATEVGNSDAAYFQRGLITNLLNPKAALFYVAILPTFVDSARPLLWQTAGLSIVYVSIATAIHAMIVTLAATARPYLEDPDRSRSARRALSLLLAAVAMWLAFSTKR